MRCPVCEKSFELQATVTPPFCSLRCQQIDLGRWLNESYSVPFSRPVEDEMDEYLEQDTESEG